MPSDKIIPYLSILDLGILNLGILDLGILNLGVLNLGILNLGILNLSILHLERGIKSVGYPTTSYSGVATLSSILSRVATSTSTSNPSVDHRTERDLFWHAND